MKKFEIEPDWQVKCGAPCEDDADGCFEPCDLHEGHGGLHYCWLMTSGIGHALVSGDEDAAARARAFAGDES